MARQSGVPPDHPAERLFEFGGRHSLTGTCQVLRQRGQHRPLARERGDALRRGRMCGEIGYHVAPPLNRKLAIDECVQFVFTIPARCIDLLLLRHRAGAASDPEGVRTRPASEDQVWRPSAGSRAGPTGTAILVERE